MLSKLRDTEAQEQVILHDSMLKALAVQAQTESFLCLLSLFFQRHHINPNNEAGAVFCRKNLTKPSRIDLHVRF